MTERTIELLIALVIYVISMSVLLAVVYHFLVYWHLSAFNFFMAGGVLFLVALGWGYLLTGILFAGHKQREDRLITLSKEILHELNIPLSTIQANTALLRRTLDDEATLKRLARIDDASLRLQKLYDTLVYAIRKEVQPIVKERFDVKDMVEERVAICQEQKRHRFALLLSSYEIEVDKIGFAQMLDNILGNAMKYAAKETLITISLNHDTLCIKDEGRGMTTLELLRVYERYFQENIEQEGKGIGLTLVKAYCDSENIEIRIDSKKNRGTKVCLVFT